MPALITKTSGAAGNPFSAAPEVFRVSGPAFQALPFRGRRLLRRAWAVPLAVAYGLAQLGFPDLSGSGPRQQVGDDELPGAVRARQRLAAMPVHRGDELRQPFGVLRDIAGGDDHGDDAFAPLVVTLADHGDLLDPGVIQQRGFDGLCGDVFAAGLDDVLDAVDEPEDPLVVEGPHVGGVQPAAVEDLGRLREVVLHDAAAAVGELSGFACRQHGAGGRFDDGGRGQRGAVAPAAALVEVHVRPLEEADGQRLGHAGSEHHAHARESLCDEFPQALLHRCHPVQQRLQVIEGMAVGGAPVQQALDHDRQADEVGGLRLHDGPAELFHIESGQDVDRAAHGQHRQHDRVERGGVEQRKHQRGHRRFGAPVDSDVRGVGVHGEHHRDVAGQYPLRVGGRARGEHHLGDLTIRDDDLGRGVGVDTLDVVGESLELIPGPVPGSGQRRQAFSGSVSDDDDVLEVVGKLGADQVQLRKQILVDDDHPRSRRADGLDDARGPAQQIDHHRSGTHLRRTEVADDDFRAVRGHHRDQFARSHAEGNQPVRQAVRLFLQLGVGDRTPVPDDRGPVAEGRRRPGGHVSDGDATGERAVSLGPGDRIRVNGFCDGQAHCAALLSRHVGAGTRFVTPATSEAKRTIKNSQSRLLFFFRRAIVIHST